MTEAARKRTRSLDREPVVVEGRAQKRARKLVKAFNLVEDTMIEVAEELAQMAKDGRWKTEPGSELCRPIYRYPWTEEPLLSLVEAAGGEEHFKESYLALFNQHLHLGGQKNERDFHGNEFSVWKPEYLPGNEHMIDKGKEAD